MNNLNKVDELITEKLKSHPEKTAATIAKEICEEDIA